VRTGELTLVVVMPMLPLSDEVIVVWSVGHDFTPSFVGRRRRRCSLLGT